MKTLSNFIINMLVMGEYRLLRFGDMAKILWLFQMFVNAGPDGVGNFKTLLSYFFHPLTAKHHEGIVYDCRAIAASYELHYVGCFPCLSL